MNQTASEPKPPVGAEIISRYQWPDSSTVSGMVIKKLPTDKLRCILSANDNTNAGALGNLPDYLKECGYEHVYPDVDDKGSNVLVIDRVKKPEKLLADLAQANVIAGSPEVETLKPLEARQGVLGRALTTIKGDTLKWSGRIGLVGHAAIALDGHIRGETQRIQASFGAINPIILSVYGNGKSEVDFNEMMDRMVSYFRSEGLELPDMDYPERNISFLNGLNNLLASYPLQIGHTLGSYGSLMQILTGVHQARAEKRLGPLGMAYAGATSLIGNAAIVLIPESRKSKDEERNLIDQLKYGVTHLPDGMYYAATQPTKVPGAMWQFVKDSPLRFNGLLNLTDNVGWFVTGYTEFKNNDRTGMRLYEPGVGFRPLRLTPYLSCVTALSFATATILSAISSKHRDAAQLQDEIYEPVFAAAAKFLVHMPKAHREDALQRMAIFLAEQEVVKEGEISADRIVSEVRDRVDVMEHSPWIRKIIKHDNDNLGAAAAVA